MQYLVTSAEMKEYDRRTMEIIGIFGEVLMERAALGAADQIEEDFPADKKWGTTVLILVGCGNNGGDGLALARILSDRGYLVDVLFPGDENKATEQWKFEKKILSFPGYEREIRFMNDNYLPCRAYDIYVDAFFGVGLSREVGDPFCSLIEEVNRRKGYKVSLDIPSGICADNGKVLGCAFRADVTVTFGFAKRGLFFYPGCGYAGKVVTKDVGIGRRAFLSEEPGMFYLDEGAETLMPERVPFGNKGTFGKALIVAGSHNMAGAAILCARACYRMGAGMVKVITSVSNRIIMQESLPEALLGTFEDLEESLAWADVAAVGPGLSTGEEAGRALCLILEKSRIPLVMDADALNLMAKNKDIRELVLQNTREGRSIVMTPHVGELARISGIPTEKLKDDLPGYASETAEKFGAVLVAKDARTFTCAVGKPICMNVRGTDKMATAGSGDVLCGMILSLMAQGLPGYEAACRGVCLHALFGEEAARAEGKHGLMAGDLVDRIICPAKNE